MAAGKCHHWLAAKAWRNTSSVIPHSISSTNQPSWLMRTVNFGISSWRLMFGWLRLKIFLILAPCSSSFSWTIFEEHFAFSNQKIILAVWSFGSIISLSRRSIIPRKLFCLGKKFTSFHLVCLARLTKFFHFCCLVRYFFCQTTHIYADRSSLFYLKFGISKYHWVHCIYIRGF
jgi:hypothetical protein